MRDQDGLSAGEQVLTSRLSPQDLDKLKQFVTLLGERDKNIFKLWSGLGDGCPYDCTQIAYIFDTSPGDIESRVQEIRLALRDYSLGTARSWL